MTWRGFAKAKAYLWEKIAKSPASRIFATSGRISTTSFSDFDRGQHRLVECRQLNLLRQREAETQKPRPKIEGMYLL
jgi:hypothetical protein